MKHFCLSIYFAFFTILVFGQISVEDIKDNRAKDIVLALQKNNKLFPQKKSYLQTDKPEYNVNETIWFKVFYLENSDLAFDTITSNMYVDLTNWKGNVVWTKRLKLEKGIAFGEFAIADTFSDGNYKIRAYTNWMRNFEDNFMYSTYIKINNSLKKHFKYVDYKTYKSDIRRWKTKHKKIDVQLFPEGGNLVSGITSVVGIKAIDEMGKPIKIDGEIKCKNRNTILFSTNERGLGKVELTPDSKEKLQGIVFFNKKKYSVKLPNISENGVVMRVDNTLPDSILLDVFIKRIKSDDRNFTDNILIAQSHNTVFYTYTFTQDTTHLFHKIPKNIFPGGIVQLTLFNGRKEALCERLVFISPSKNFKINIEPDKEIYEGRQKIIVDISTTDQDNKLVDGNVSICVTDENLVKHDSEKPTILSYLYLASDIAGKIDSLNLYFSPKNPNKEADMNLLLLTQGWRRYNWKNIFAPKDTLPKFYEENKITIGGFVTRDIIKFPSKNSPVKLSILSNFNDVFDTKTNKQGYFYFDNLDYYDTIDVKIEAQNWKGRKNVYIDIEDSVPAGKSFENNANINKNLLSAKGTAKPQEKKQIDDGHDRIYAQADAVYRPGNEASTFSDVLQMMQGRVAGVSIAGNSCIIRGINTLYGSTDPLLVVDGVITDFNMIHSISPMDVDVIEVLKGPSTAIYGSRGANGVIAIYTKRGFFVKKGHIEFKMMGYSRGKEFYVPKYDSPADTYNDADLRSVIYWNPNIKTSSKAKSKISFFASDAKSSFYLYSEGIVNKKPVEAERRIQTK